MSTTTPPTSLPAPPAINTSGFGGYVVPAQVATQIINLLVDQAPFAASLERQPTTSNRLVMPTASPTGAAWINELQRIPEMSLNDEAYVIAVAKLAGLLDISNEMLSDSAFNVTTAFATLLGDSLSVQLDQGLLFGEGPPEPAGVVAVAPPVTGADLLAAVSTAIGEISDAGGQANTVAAAGSVLAAENTRTAPDGHLVYGAGFVAAVGLTAVAVPTLGDDVLVYDSTRMRLVVNGELSSVDISNDYHFEYDATTMRIKTRVAVGCPAPDKTIRRWTPPGESGGTGSTTRATGATKRTAKRS